jgi:hypothetical protein
VNVGAISALGGIATVGLNVVKNGIAKGDPVLTLGVTPTCFNGPHPVINVIDNKHFQYLTGCPDVAGSGGQFTGPADKPMAPSDRHVYHVMAWDAARQMLDTGFGSSINGGPTGNCPDCADFGWYTFDPLSGLWNEQCGPNMTPCNTNVAGVQSSAAAGDETFDVVAVVGGLINGSAIADTVLWNRGLNTFTEICGQEKGYIPCPFSQRSRVSIVSIGNGRFVMFGGFDRNNVSLNETWILTLTGPTAGTWCKVTSAVNPPPAAWPALTYVPSINQVMLVGAGTSGAHAWSFDPVTLQWTDLAVPTGPTLCSDSNCPFYGGNAAYADTAVYDPGHDQIVLLHVPDGTQTHAQIWSLAPVAGSAQARQLLGRQYNSKPVGGASRSRAR